MKERGYILGVVVIALVALSVGGAASLTLSGGEADLAGQVRKQKQLQACAMAGADASIAQLPSGAPTAVSLDANYSAAPGHYPTGGTYTSGAGKLDKTQAPDLAAGAAVGANVINFPRGAAGLRREPYRYVTTCSGPNGQTSEAEKTILYGVSQ